MAVSAYVLVLLSAILLSGSLVTIVILLDNGAQSAIQNVIESLQEKTLALSGESVKREVLAVVPLLDRFLIEVHTGWGDCSAMDTTDLKYFFESQMRTLMLKIAVYVYTSEMRNYMTIKDDPMQNWWQDCNCYWTGDDGSKLGCLRPMGDGYEENYDPSEPSFPFNVTTPVGLELKNYTDQYYEQRIASLTIKNVNGSWSSPYYFYEEVSGLSYALQTLSVPLRFSPDGRCTKAASVDVSLKYVGSALAKAKASPESTLYILEPVTGVLVSVSDPSIVLWDVDHDNALWPVTACPNALISTVSQEYFSRQPDRAEKDDGFFYNFETSVDGTKYLVATRHIRHIDLVWVMVDITPRDYYYKKLDDARIVSVSVGAAIGCVALMVTVFVFVFLIRNLNALGLEMDKLATMDVDSEPIPANVISEINHLVEIFNLVVKNMKLFKSLMPSSAFDPVADDDEEEENVMSPVADDLKPNDGEDVRSPGVGATPQSKNLTIRPAPSSKAGTVSSNGGGSVSSKMSKVQTAKTNLKDAFALRLEVKQASLFEVRIKGFAHYASTTKSDDVIATHGNHITFCNNMMKEFKGVLGYVMADRIQFHWNVQNKISGAAPKVAAAALALRNADTSEKVIGVLHQGRLMGGYMGTEGIRGYQLVGSHMDLINKMFFRVEKNLARLLCSFAFRQDVWTNYDVREIDEVDDVRLFELMAAAKQNEDEWMYQLEGNDAKTGKHAAFDQGWSLWREGKHSEAVEVMEKYCFANETDIVAKALLQRWQTGKK